MASIKNKMSLSQEKFKNDFYRVIYEIHQAFTWNHSSYQEFSVDNIKKQYEIIKNVVDTKKTSIEISKDNIFKIRQLLIRINSECVLNLITNFQKRGTDNIISEFWRIQYKGYEIAIQKNQDYGDSFREHGFMGVLVRLSDKIKRLINISKNKKNINFEAQEDTFKDLANYCVMGVFLLDESETENKSIKNNNSTFSCYYCSSNEHQFYYNSKDKYGKNIRILECPKLKEKQSDTFCNYCHKYGHNIYYKFGPRYIITHPHAEGGLVYGYNENQKLYTCPKIIQKLKGNIVYKRNTYDGYSDEGAPCGPYDAYGNYKPDGTIS